MSYPAEDYFCNLIVVVGDPNNNYLELMGVDLRFIWMLDWIRNLKILMTEIYGR